MEQDKVIGKITRKRDIFVPEVGTIPVMNAIQEIIQFCDLSPEIQSLIAKGEEYDQLKAKLDEAERVLESFRDWIHREWVSSGGSMDTKISHYSVINGLEQIDKLNKSVKPKKKGL